MSENEHDKVSVSNLFTDVNSTDHQVNPMSGIQQQWKLALRATQVLYKEFQNDIIEIAKVYPELKGAKAFAKMSIYRVRALYEKLPDPIKNKWRSIRIPVPCAGVKPVITNPFNEYDSFREYGVMEGYTKCQNFAVNVNHLNPSMYGIRMSTLLVYTDDGTLTPHEYADPSRRGRMPGYWDFTTVLEYISNNIK